MYFYMFGNPINMIYYKQIWLLNYILVQMASDFLFLSAPSSWLLKQLTIDYTLIHTYTHTHTHILTYTQRQRAYLHLFLETFSSKNIFVYTRSSSVVCLIRFASFTQQVHISVKRRSVLLRRSLKRWNSLLRQPCLMYLIMMWVMCRFISNVNITIYGFSLT